MEVRMKTVKKQGGPGGRRSGYYEKNLSPEERNFLKVLQLWEELAIMGDPEMVLGYEPDKPPDDDKKAA